MTRTTERRLPFTFAMLRRAPIAPVWLGVGVAVLMVAVMGLLRGHLSVQQMVLGREVQRLGQAIYDAQVEIAALETTLAARWDYETLAEQARALGFRPVSPREMLFVPVAATPPPAVQVVRHATAAPLLPVVTPAPWERPAYRETLWDWLRRSLWLPGGTP